MAEARYDLNTIRFDCMCARCVLSYCAHRIARHAGATVDSLFIEFRVCVCVVPLIVYDYWLRRLSHASGALMRDDHHKKKNERHTVDTHKTRIA